MTEEVLKQKEKKIGQFFNRESKSYAKRHDDKGIGKSALRHASFVGDQNIESVLDVGSGPGSVLIEMLKNGVKVGFGIDLSKEMNEIARKRILEEGIEEDRFTLGHGSFLDMNKENFPDMPEQVDAVSLHMVLCCHPDREAMLDKTTSLNPTAIVLTVPRRWLVLRFVVGIYGLFSKIRGAFRPFIHSQKSIDKQLSEVGYKLVERKKSLGWVMSAYTKE